MRTSLSADTLASYQTQRDPTVQALRIPELINIICGMISKGDATVAARVCCAWTEVALDHVWSDLSDVTVLLRLLQPLTHTRYGWDFAESDAPFDWTKFFRHARRVITLHYQSEDHLADGLVLQLATALASRPECCLLPRVKTIEWTSNWTDEGLHLLLFVSPSLQNISLNAVCFFSQAERKVFRAVCDRAASLRSIKSSRRLDPTDTTELPDPGFLWNNASFTCLERHTDLSTLMIREYHTSQETIDTVCQNHQKLEVLFATVQVPRGTWAVFAVPDGLGHLSKLRILVLDIREASGAPTGGKVEFATLQPLLNCHALSHLMFRANVVGECLDLAAEDIRVMGEAWPTMEVLELGGGRGGGTSLGHLADFASAFGPKLTHLAHQFTFQDDLPRPNGTQTRFSSLEILNFGKMRYDQESVPQVAEFIGGLTPAWVRVSDEETTWHDQMSGDTLIPPDFEGEGSSTCADLMSIIECLGYPENHWDVFVRPRRRYR